MRRPRIGSRLDIYRVTAVPKSILTQIAHRARVFIPEPVVWRDTPDPLQAGGFGFPRWVVEGPWVGPQRRSER